MARRPSTTFNQRQFLTLIMFKQRSKVNNNFLKKTTKAQQLYPVSCA